MYHGFRAFHTRGQTRTDLLKNPSPFRTLLLAPLPRLPKTGSSHEADISERYACLDWAQNQKELSFERMQK
jgi:hypothetical protein